MDLTGQLYCLSCSDGKVKLITSDLGVPNLIFPTTDGRVLLQYYNGNHASTKILSLIGEEGDEMIIMAR